MQFSLAYHYLALFSTIIYFSPPLLQDTTFSFHPPTYNHIRKTTPQITITLCVLCSGFTMRARAGTMYPRWAPSKIQGCSGRTEDWWWYLWNFERRQIIVYKATSKITLQHLSPGIGLDCSCVSYVLSLLSWTIWFKEPKCCIVSSSNLLLSQKWGGYFPLRSLYLCCKARLHLSASTKFQGCRGRTCNSLSPQKTNKLWRRHRNQKNLHSKIHLGKFS